MGALLRKCKVLAVRLGSAEFKDWVESELNGYVDKDNILAYRVMNVNCHGDFSGALGGGMKNAPIPPLSIPENFREPLFTCHLPQPVSSLEDLITNSDDGTVQVPWVADVTALLRYELSSSMESYPC
ncbi:AbiTii domain-containing protein [Aliivibrio fischeri]|uniref:AbiTii domain-containing protein n=1 Tax=Aliivibrio fischeri TaxID=668 RepID=UPI0022A995C4